LGRVCVFLKRLGKKGDSRSLSLAHCDLTATDLLELATLLQFLPQVEEMDISWNELIGGSLTALTSHLQHVGEVRTLRLCSCRLNSEDVVALGEALSHIPALEVLDLSWNSGVGAVVYKLTQEVDTGGFRELVSSLSHATSSPRFDCRWFTPLPPSVGELDLSCNKLLAGGLSRLTFHLAHVTHLERLDLHLCCLMRDDLEALIQVLPSLTALTELDVSSNKEVGGVVHPLVSALPVTQMRRLPFNSCYLSNESWPEMVKTLCLCISPGGAYLRTVDISWCKVVGGHLALLLDALQPSVVSELHLCSCEFTTDDMQHLDKVISYQWVLFLCAAAVCRRGCLSSLRALDLSYNSLVGDDGWCSLFAAGGLGSLEDVDVSLRPLTSAPCSAWLPALLQALPQMPALARLAMQRWTADCQEREQLRYCLKKRSVLLEWDPDLQDTSSACKGNSQESLEESQPEE
ncbi:leucine-rich repeat-containing protein 31, partial [Oreochromis niloticus]|uniref:leucine-rich repeat-containing protein 31 n=1 Tax=Oreochromis niloticus TaxID=8128 RepID=UPI000DF1B085